MDILVCSSISVPAAMFWSMTVPATRSLSAVEILPMLRLLLSIFAMADSFESPLVKDNDVWIYGTDMDTETIYYDEDMTGNVAIVIGSEGFGMSRLVKENCDFLIKIPLKGKITSLNASVSAGIVMYEVVKQRKIK